MDYNSTRDKLVIPAYGRNVQKMAAYLLTVEDRTKRTNLAKALVNIMGQLNPDQKDSADYKRKLWDHLYMITNYQLDVDGPFPKPDAVERKKKPRRIPYPQENIRFRPYGKTIAKMIEKACLFDEGPERNLLVQNMANHLKKSYLNWNRETVNDELIGEHLSILSRGILELTEETKLAQTSDLLSKARQYPPSTAPTNFKRKKYSKQNQANYNRNKKRN